MTARESELAKLRRRLREVTAERDTARRDADILRESLTMVRHDAHAAMEAVERIRRFLHAMADPDRAAMLERLTGPQR